MLVRLLGNPRSGRGKAATVASAFESALRAAGHEVVSGLVGDPSPPPGSGPTDVVAVIGGDGTLHRALPELALHTGRPPCAVYHVPTGTENLFARQFGMTDDPARLLAALAGGRVENIDLAECNGSLFALMVSAGADAGVVHRLNAARSGTIRPWSYARPLLAETLAPSLGPLRLVVDGRELAAGRGVAIVANSRQYGMRLDPARHASMSDGLLDAVFIPCSTGASLLARVAALRLGRLRGVISAQGTNIQIDGSEQGAASPVQMDGEASDTRLPLECRVVPGALRVLVP